MKSPRHILNSIIICNLYYQDISNSVPWTLFNQSLWFFCFRIGSLIPVWITEHIILFLKLPYSCKGSGTTLLFSFYYQCQPRLFNSQCNSKSSVVSKWVSFMISMSLGSKDSSTKKQWSVYCPRFPCTLTSCVIIFNIFFLIHTITIHILLNHF